MSRQINFNLAATAATVFIITHILVQLSDGEIVRPRAHIKHQRVPRLNVFAHALEKPLVAIDLAVVPLLDGQNEVDTAAIELLAIFQTEVPGARLE